MSASLADPLGRTRQLADAVLYEGYVLYPYHAAATKNRYRWQFGVLVPERQVALGIAESATMQSQLLVRGPGAARLHLVLRFLQPQLRQVERVTVDGGFAPVDDLVVNGELHTTWEEGIEHEHVLGPAEVPHGLDDLLARGAVRTVGLEASHRVEQLRDADGMVAGRLVRTTAPVELAVQVRAERLAPDVTRATTAVTNVTGWADPEAERAETVRHGVAGLHLVVVADGAELASAIDPPRWAAPHAGGCDNVGTYPVLAGPRDDHSVVLSAPIILHDHPEIAAESPGDAYDATEIHELLSLAVQGLTDEEKRAARATDARAAAVIDEADHLPPEMAARLHGVIRGLGPAADAPLRSPAGRGDREGPAADLDGVQLNEPAASHPLEDELAEFLGAGQTPLQRVGVDGRQVEIGDRVVLRPNRRADAQDVFVAEQLARVTKIVETLEGEVQVGVILDADPAAELNDWYGRYLYFHLDEIAVEDDEGESGAKGEVP